MPSLFCLILMFYCVSAHFLREHGKFESDSIMRAKATVAFHSGNYKELYSILETREFESRLASKGWNPIFLIAVHIISWKRNQICWTWKVDHLRVYYKKNIKSARLESRHKEPQPYYGWKSYFHLGFNPWFLILIILIDIIMSYKRCGIELITVKPRRSEQDLWVSISFNFFKFMVDQGYVLLRRQRLEYFLISEMQSVIHSAIFSLK